ncbi:MAG: TetR/AcrR family transcriptional regulator [bacterium]|nr:TetR/AcrR family transcriptional regulator [bacterium]
MTSTSEKILDSAQQLLGENGVEGVTMRAIGRLVGITPMAIYRHYPDRNALLDALYDRGFTQLEIELRKGLRARSPAGRVAAMMNRYVEFAIAAPHEFSVMFVHRVRATRRFPEDFDAGRSATFAMVAEQVAMILGVKPGAAAARDMTLTIWATFHGLVMLHRAGRFDAEGLRRLGRSSWRALLAGMSA